MLKEQTCLEMELYIRSLAKLRAQASVSIGGDLSIKFDHSMEHWGKTILKSPIELSLARISRHILGWTCMDFKFCSDLLLQSQAT